MPHTPGPWTWRADAPTEIVFDDSVGENVMPRIATIEIDNTEPSQWLADRALIAAAPDMLDTLRMLLTHVKECRKHNCPPDNYAIAAISAALRKAEGVK